MSATQEVHELGYVLHPPRRESEPGYSQVDIRLAALASGQHFDPEEARLTVVFPPDGVSQLTIEHPWSNEKLYRTCPGHIYIADRLGKHLELFTFGGEAHILTDIQETQVSLRSPAPILVPAGGRREVILLAEEVEVLLAQRRAARENEPEAFERNLANAPPLGLYLAMLLTLQEKYQHLHYGEDESVTRFKHLLRVEVEAVEEIAPESYGRTLEELL